VLSDGFYGDWVLVDGRAGDRLAARGHGGLVEYYRRVAANTPTGTTYRAAMERERRVLLRISIDRVGNQSGDGRCSPNDSVSTSPPP